MGYEFVGHVRLARADQETDGDRGKDEDKETQKRKRQRERERKRAGANYRGGRRRVNKGGLEIGCAKTNWSSTNALEVPWLKAGDRQVVWEEHSTFGSICMTLSGNLSASNAASDAISTRNIQDVAQKLGCPWPPQNLRMSAWKNQHGQA